MTDSQKLTPAQLAASIDHTLLKPEATATDIEGLCKEALDYRFAAVCINPSYVALAADRLKGSTVAVCTVIGFPLGTHEPEIKAFEAGRAVAAGADEVDMVINVGALRSGNADLVKAEIEAVVGAARQAGEKALRGGRRFVDQGRPLVKVIIETCFLTDDQKRLACRLAAGAGADYVKTSTGFGPAGAKVEDVRLMAEAAGGLKVKAAGGIRDLATAKAMLEAGASRLGASAGVKLVKELADAV